MHFILFEINCNHSVIYLMLYVRILIFKFKFTSHYKQKKIISKKKCYSKLNDVKLNNTNVIIFILICASYITRIFNAI